MEEWWGEIVEMGMESGRESEGTSERRWQIKEGKVKWKVGRTRVYVNWADHEQ